MKKIGVLAVMMMATVSLVAGPNFIVINIDDMGYADIGPFGSELNRTPNLDKMAAEGMKLTCFYAAPVCSPSRSALMTGCYPKRVMPIASVLFPASAVGLNPKEETVAEVLKAKGYATGCVGKWHLGDQPEFLPNAQGFDSYLGLPYSNDMGTAKDGSKSDLGAKVPDVKLANLTGNDETGLRGNSQPPLPLLKDNKVIARVRQDEQQSLVKIYTEAAVEFIRGHQQEPFFLYLPHSAVHFPLYPGKNFHGKSKNGLIGDWIEELDWSVGQVLGTLRELNLAEKTLVIFTSDNGGTARSVNKPLRGFKGSTLEGGMRVPTLAWWPGKVPAGTSSDEMTGMLDVLPTLAELAEAKLPKAKIDGGSIAPILLGKTGAKSPRDTFYYFRGMTLEAVRQRNWKLQLVNSGNKAAGNPKGTKSKKQAAPIFPQLYDLATDIGEATDVAKAHPEVVAKLQALAAEMDSDLGTQGSGPGVRELGRVASPLPLISLDGEVRPGFK